MEQEEQGEMVVLVGTAVLILIWIQPREVGMEEMGGGEEMVEEAEIESAPVKMA